MGKWLDIMYNRALQSMRVVGGKTKGLRLKGAVTKGTRATTERVRSAIFNILHEEIYQEGRVLDLFAGSGSLGIEALSRGAAWADFVEWDRRQCAVIRSNLQHTGFSSNACVYTSDVNRSLDNLEGGYQLLLMDPPYTMEDLDPLLEKLGDLTELMVQGGIVVVGHSRFLELKLEYGQFRQISHRRYGDNVVDFYQQANGII